MRAIIPLLAAILVTEVTSQSLYVRKDAVRKNNERNRVIRQTNADQMVHNILQWIQEVYNTKSRRTRQGSLREYLPPSNTQRPRPFQPQTQIPTGSEQVFTGYPYPGNKPQPPFQEMPAFTTPEPRPIPSESPEDNGIFPGTGYPSTTEYTSKPITGYPLSTTTGFEGPSTIYTSPTTGYPIGPSTSTSKYPEATTGYPGPSTGYPGPSTGYPGPSTGYPGPSTGYPGPSTGYPGPSTGYPGPSTGYPGPSTGYPVPSTGYPGPSTGYPGPSTGYPGPSTGYPGPSTGYPGPSTGLSPGPSPSTEHFDHTTGSSIGYPGSSTGYPGSSTSLQTIPTRPPDSDGGESGDSGSYRPPEGADEDLHPPHIHNIEVECAKDMMTINLEFNRAFNGVIYSKGFFSQPECRYVDENSNRVKYTFTVGLNSCGTQFVSAFETQGQSYLENVLVLQNEASIQEVWDTIRSVRCLWEGNLNKALSVALSVGMLNQEIVTFSGDTAMARLDIQLGKGPFAPNANGLVKIGETMTLVVSVMGDPAFDIQVKDCKAHDSNNQNLIQLTDENGCVLKPKIFGAFQKTRDTQDTGASILAYAYFSAFKFPDEMDLILECNIELCKTNCEVCPDPNQKLEPGKRRKRQAANDSGPVTIAKTLKVILPEDITDHALILCDSRNSICLSTQTFIFSSSVLISLLTFSTILSTYLWLKPVRK